MAHPLLDREGGATRLLLGNEAIVRGALEAGVQFISCYPGTPSSEAPDTFFRLSGDADYTFEYSANEKVALEVGAGASLAGAMTMVTMKHVGVNVAADPLMTLAYVGAPGGLLLLSADDPGCHSSQNEQDNRYYARLANIACFEPSTAQECKDMTRDALLYSRQYGRPVMIRTTTRVNHLRGPVQFGPLPEKTELVEFSKNPSKFVPVPAFARPMRLRLLEDLDRQAADADASKYNRVWGDGETGIVASSITRSYLHDALEETGWKDRFRVLELGMSWPFPEKLADGFLRQVKDKVLILEELEPLVENELRALINRKGPARQIVGKADENTSELPRNGEYSTASVKAALAKVLGEEAPAPELCETEQNLPIRPPNLCAGCAHRSVYYAVRQMFGDEAVYSSDIGCYTLGLLPPLSAADFLICMGSSVSAGSGFAKASGKSVVAFIGDSTFFHTGVNGLINAVFNQHDLLLVVLDNRTTAMTGHQPHPGVDPDVAGCCTVRVDIEAVCKGCGVEHVRKAPAYNQKKLDETIAELRALSGVRVLIAEEPCVLYARRKMRKKPTTVAYIAEQTEAVKQAVGSLACPAFFREAEEVRINEDQCTGCMVCVQISSDIKARKREG